MKRAAGVLLIAGWLAGIGVARAATTFNLQFDNEGINAGNASSDGPLAGPIIGTGTFTSPNDLAPGTYALPTLPGFALSVTVGVDSYDQTNITTPLTGAAVRIVQSGAGERLFFTESGGAGSDGGTSGGALDLNNGTASLTFEPSFFGGNFLYQERQAGVAALSGRYCAVSTGGVCSTPVPEPSGLALLATGIGVLFAFRRRPSAA